MNKTALVIGASGATGQSLLPLLLADQHYAKIILFVRRDLGIDHEKITTHVVDFDHPEDWQSLVKGDIVFSCLGTTLKDAGNQSAQWEVDYTYQYNFAKIADANGVPTYLVVSSIGADAQSFFFYNRMKGQLEQDIQALPFKNTLIFRPGPLIRNNTTRRAEKIGIKVIRFLNQLGILLKQKPLPTSLLAAAMINASKEPSGGVSILDNRTIHSIGS